MMGTRYTETTSSPYEAGNYLSVPNQRGFHRSHSDIFSTSHMRSNSMETLAHLDGPSSPLTAPSSHPRSPNFHKSQSVATDISRSKTGHQRPGPSFENTQYSHRAGKGNQSLPRTISEESRSPSRNYLPQNGRQDSTGKLDSSNVPGGGDTRRRRHGRQFRWCQYCGLVVFLAVLALVGYGVYEGISRGSSSNNGVNEADENTGDRQCTCPTLPPVTCPTLPPVTCPTSTEDLLTETPTTESADVEDAACDVILPDLLQPADGSNTEGLTCEGRPMGLHDHPLTCNSFYYCVGMADVAMVGTCPPGCYFHPGFMDRCLHQQSGHYQDPYNCSQFHICQAQVAGIEASRSRVFTCHAGDNMGFSTHEPGPAPLCLPREQVPGCEQYTGGP